MKVLFLGDPLSPLVNYLILQGERVLATWDKIDPQTIETHKPDFLVSYGYRHILRENVLGLLPDRAINLHIAFLPWNRGADPNFWSFVEHTPKGVTIHYLDKGVDTGDIIAQLCVMPFPNDTFKTSYHRLQYEMQKLFFENWGKIRAGECPRSKQGGLGTFHYSKDKERLMHMLTEGWDTPVSVFDGYEE